MPSKRHDKGGLPAELAGEGGFAKDLPSLPRRGTRGGNIPLLVGNTPEVNRLAKRLGIKAVQLTCETFPDSETKLNFSPLLSKEGIKGWSNAIVFYQFNTAEPVDAQILRLISLLYFLSSNPTSKGGKSLPAIALATAGSFAKDLPSLPRRGTRGGSNLSLILPYFPYARALPLKTLSELSSTQPLFRAIMECVTRLYVVELHCPTDVLQQYIKPVPITEISMCSALSAFIKKKFKSGVVLVSPDEGSAGRVACVAGQVSSRIIVMQKKRKSATEVTITGVREELKTDPKKTHVIIDDIISTGGTLKQAAAQLRAQGVKDIACVVTHNVANQATLRSFSAANLPLHTSSSLIEPHPPSKGGKGGFALDILDTIVTALKN